MDQRLCGFRHACTHQRSSQRKANSEEDIETLSHALRQGRGQRWSANIWYVGLLRQQWVDSAVELPLLGSPLLEWNVSALRYAWKRSWLLERAALPIWSGAEYKRQSQRR